MNKAKTKLSFIIILSVIVILISAFVLAQPGKERVLATNQKSGNTVTIPAHAVQVAENVFSLGIATDVDGNVVEGYAIIHKKDGNAKPPWAGGGNGGGSTCYGFLANGAKWKIIEPYMVNPANTRGLSSTFVTGNLAADIAKWETAATKNILGDEIAGIVDGADRVSPDNKNEVYFADITESGVIGITIVWGYFSGPPSWRELVEWDQVYDDVSFDWSATGEEGKMDFENIATHELGHSVGMADLYDSVCSQETMYGYASEGETNKRSLEAGDIAGVKKLYS